MPLVIPSSGAYARPDTAERTARRTLTSVQKSIRATPTARPVSTYWAHTAVTARRASAGSTTLVARVGDTG